MSIPLPEFPLAQRERSVWKNLNGEWDFALFTHNDIEKETIFALDRSGYDRTITVPFSWTCPLSGVNENEAGIGWYRKTVEFDGEGRVFLCFGAVDYIADVYVNGVAAFHHQGGYTMFETDVTGLWKPGENVIEVRSEDFRRENQLYGKQGYGEIQGIWQTVWLERRPDNYIESFIIDTRINGEIAVKAKVSAPDGEVVTADFDDSAHTALVSNKEASISFKIDDPRLWSPDDPYLYFGTLSVSGGDCIKTYFGVREIAAELWPGKDFKWITLNGKPLYVNGTLDQAFNPKGYFTYPTDGDMRDEVWRVKRLGLNMMRIHIKPEQPRKLYWADRTGVLVMEDIPCFWGPPTDEARSAYESEWPDVILRDVNHPSIFSWVMFNESWGLLDKIDGEKTYLPKTQQWVESVYRRAKLLDPTRLIEDNSPCRFDHIDTDINTWHFYLNGYEVVRDHIRKVVADTYAGSKFNYIGGRTQNSAPLMNSECGMVWGVDNSAGDSDIAWQYHYMLNEYRLHEKVSGFVFTEFHDVVNEFNGYYRIDNQDKDFGYEDFCLGMTIGDLHAADFVATDCPPCQTVSGGSTVSVPLVLSSFSDANHAHGAVVKWTLWHDSTDGRVTDGMGEIDVRKISWGTNAVADLEVTMPDENAVEVLSIYLIDRKGSVVSRNFVTFDVRAENPKNVLEIPVCEAHAEGFEPVWFAMGGEKLSMGGSGEVGFEFKIPSASLNRLSVCFEAGSKRVLKKDKKQVGDPEEDLGFMRGYLVDRGAFENSYWMTDEERFLSDVEVSIDGEVVANMRLENDWADSRGVLSWHSQPNVRRLDEAGSYGELKKIEIPSRMLPTIVKNGGFKLKFKVTNGGGLALYGRGSGRFPIGVRASWS